MSRIAVIGAGISGLATSWLLSRRHDVVLLEQSGRIGGHTHTHCFDTPDGRLALDTGFLVHNTRTYPLLVRLFEELGVACLDSDMSFGVTDPSSGFEYSTRNLNGLFADRRNLWRPRHYAMLAGILRFNRASRALAARPTTITLGDFLRQHHLSGDVVDRFLLPLAAAIWSASPSTLRDFPALTLVRFFQQHGMNTVLDHPTWRVVAGGSATYIPKLLASPRITVRTNAGPSSVQRTMDGVDIHFPDRPTERVDEVVFACHGDDVLPLLADPTDTERDILGQFQTSANLAILHTDDTWLPRRAAARASWNYTLSGSTGAATVTYDLNRLQRLSTTRPYLVTLNPERPIAPYQQLATMHYTHPLYTRAAIAAQERWAEVSGHHRTHYCGAYWFYGFHEDGLRSAVRVANMMGIEW